MEELTKGCFCVEASECVWERKGWKERKKEGDSEEEGEEKGGAGQGGKWKERREGRMENLAFGKVKWNLLDDEGVRGLPLFRSPILWLGRMPSSGRLGGSAKPKQGQRWTSIPGSEVGIGKELC